MESDRRQAGQKDRKGAANIAKEGLYSIGKASKICNVSPRTLQYYEEVGLLNPDRIDERSGYRYYSAESMYQVQVIRYLRDESFSLEEIGQILHEEDLVRLREIFSEKIASTRRTIDYYHRREESLKAWYEFFVEGEWVLRHGGRSPAARYIPRERYRCYRCRYDSTEKPTAYIEANYKTFSELGGPWWMWAVRCMCAFSALAQLNLGIAYATWGAVGTVATPVTGYFLYR